MKTKVDTTITWVIIDSFSLQAASIYSDKFVVDGCKWQEHKLGYNKANCLSLYLHVQDIESLPIYRMEKTR